MAARCVGCQPIQPIARTDRLVDPVVDRLRDLILSGTLKPGTTLQEAELAGELGVSRTPLREALRVLARDGLLRQLSNNRTVAVELEAEDMRDFLDVREVLDGGCAV